MSLFCTISILPSQNTLRHLVCLVATILQVMRATVSKCWGCWFWWPHLSPCHMTEECRGVPEESAGDCIGGQVEQWQVWGWREGGRQWLGHGVGRMMSTVGGFGSEGGVSWQVVEGTQCYYVHKVIPYLTSEWVVRLNRRVVAYISRKQTCRMCTSAHKSLLGNRSSKLFLTRDSEWWREWSSVLSQWQLNVNKATVVSDTSIMRDWLVDEQKRYEALIQGLTSILPYVWMRI